MKTWIKRSLIGSAVAATLLVGLGAWAHRDGGYGWHRGGFSEADAVQMQARMVDRVAGKMNLDATQKARLVTLGDTVRTQRQALKGDTDPRADLQSLVAGPTFDRARAGALASNKISALQSGAPTMITAMADFYDGLKPEQQAQLREFMAKRGSGHDRGDRGERGERHGLRSGGEHHAGLGAERDDD